MSASTSSNAAPNDGNRPVAPSDLARRVTEAFKSAAKDAVAVNRSRGTTVVGEVDGEWRAEKKKASSP
jgi:hypothetical protein